MSKKKISIYLLAALLVVLFLFLRFYRIDQSLLFFNDIGRDLLVLWQWQQSGKPPLLGPQTSALPFNQSAFYFYGLYPFYLLTHGSLYATLIACAVFYLLIFGLAVYALRRQPRWQATVLLIFALISIHPQQIIQQRFVWNPSFVSPLIAAAGVIFLWLDQRLQHKQAWPVWLTWLWAASLALAVSLSYSAAPTLIAFFLLALVLFRGKAWGLALKTGLALIVTNLSTLVFELRHHFPLTSMLLTRERLLQVALSLGDKLSRFNQLIFAWPSGLTILLGLGLLAFFIKSWRQGRLQTDRLVWLSAALLLLNLLIILLAPIAVQAHYIFGLLSLLLVFLSLLTLHHPWAIYLIFALSWQWLAPSQLNRYFAPAFRSPAQSQACMVSFCQTHSEPVFIAVQAGFHPYHNGPEWQYLAAQAGCQLKDLTTEPLAASHLAVVVDASQYQHGQTAFNELTIFGPSQEIEVFSCGEQLEIHYLERE